MSNETLISSFNFGEYDARREYLRERSFFLESFITPVSFPLNTLRNNKNYIIVGQKGAGKTACQIFLDGEKKEKEGYITDLISFYDDLKPEDYKDFAKTQTINLIDISKAGRIEGIYDFKSIWKRIILLRIAKKLRENNFNNAFVEFCLSTAKGTNSIIDGIKKSLRVEVKIPLSILEAKLSFDPSVFVNNSEMSVHDFNTVAEHLFLAECRPYRLYFFVDELVLSTLNTVSDEYKARIALIRDVVRVCCSLNDACVKGGLDIHFVCTLRPEIRTRLNEIDAEISKVMDGNDVLLQWDEDSLLEIMISKIVSGAPSKNINADTFIPNKISFGVKEQDFLRFLIDQTWYKPRDMVRFLKSYSVANPYDVAITTEGTKNCLNEYARVSAAEVFEQISVTYSPAVIAGIKRSIKRQSYAMSMN